MMTLLMFLGLATAGRAEPTFTPTVGFLEVDPHLREQLTVPALAALDLVAAYPPEAGYKLDLDHDESIPGKHVDIQFVQTGHGNYFDHQSESVDHGSVVYKRRQRSEMIVILVLDRIFFRLDHQPDPHGFARLAIALAGHLYGPAQLFFNVPRDAGPHQLEFQTDVLQTAFRHAAIQFVDRVIDGERFQRMDSWTQDGFIRKQSAIRKECALALAGAQKSN